MEPVTLTNLKSFLQRLSERYPHPATIYLLGGSALCWLGSPRSTLDVDYSFEVVPEEAERFQAMLNELAAEMRLDVEYVPLGEFIPLPPEARARRRAIGRFGQLEVYVFDPYSIALSKIARGFEADLEDVVFMLHEGLSTLANWNGSLNRSCPRLARPISFSKSSRLTWTRFGAEQHRQDTSGRIEHPEASAGYEGITEHSNRRYPMSNETKPIDAEQEVEQIIKTAKTLGVEVDETDVAHWLTAMAASDKMGWEVDEAAGIYGHEITLLDFDKGTLERYRRIADVVQLPDLPNVETAISLSGSAAQGVIQLYPGDCDYFERVNIKAPTREEACQVLAKLMRDKVLDKFEGPGYQLVEVKFGTWHEDVVKDGQPISAKSPVSWAPAEVKASKMQVARASGEPWEVAWEYGCLDPGWCKMDWVIAEPEKGRVVNASNMLDVTWEAPDGSITPLDGFIDPYFQEVYLEAGSVPLFTKLAQQVSPKALDEYVRQITGEVYKYTHKHVNYGKVAKRLYNIFRLTGRHQAAALIREIFNEPTTLLYQVWSLLDTIDDAGKPDSTIDRETVVEQTDELIRDVIETTEGPMETEIVMALIRLRDGITGRKELGEEWHTLITDSRSKVEELVNDFFKEKLLGIAEVRAFLDALETQPAH